MVSLMLVLLNFEFHSLFSSSNIKHEPIQPKTLIMKDEKYERYVEKMTKRGIVMIRSEKAKEKVRKKYEKWKKINTKTYTYIAHATTIDGPPTLIFVKDNKVKKSLPLKGSNLSRDYNNVKQDIKQNDFNISKINDFNATKNILTKTYYVARNLDFYLLDNRFKTILKKYPYTLHDIVNEGYLYIVGFNIFYDDQYSYINALNGISNGMRMYHYSSPYCQNPLNYFYSFAFLQLPTNTTFDNKTTKKILKKYKEAYMCIYNEKKDKDKCFNENLVWNDNFFKRLFG